KSASRKPARLSAWLHEKCDLANGRFQLSHIKRFDKMVGEALRVAAPDVVIHSVAGDGNRGNRFRATSAKRAQNLETRAIRELQVADQEVELFRPCAFEGGANVAGNAHKEAAPLEKV